ncbi:uncharacterized protein LOC143542310 [Bidens hawaiensis]|uniref:uncharacterized protein LOC143542310 n=1 Tax=Bidens hawaiensis TaxID=980011 RepID=UPI00404A5292
MEEDNDNELMLELSIGGIFGKPKKLNRNVTESPEKNMNTQSNGRRKREEKLKELSVEYSGSCGSVSGPFVENKEWLEAQVVEPACKKEKVGLVLTAPGDDDNNCVIRPTACGSSRPYQGNVKDGGGGGGRCYCKVKSNGCATSAYSDGQCSSPQGGATATDESRSNSSNNSQLDHQQPATTSTASVEPPDRSNPHDSTILTPPIKPEPSTQHQQQASSLARMPCVSTTGNGPNGKTVSGFLYRYTKNEVSIVCVCHGRSFSPAGFVEHAGGVDITHPLKHITIFPAAFAS